MRQEVLVLYKTIEFELNFFLNKIILKVNVGWLIRRKAPVQTPYMKIFLRQLPLSRYLAKTLRVNRIAMKKPLNKFVVRSLL